MLLYLILVSWHRSWIDDNVDDHQMEVIVLPASETISPISPMASHVCEIAKRACRVSTCILSNLARLSKQIGTRNCASGLVYLLHTVEIFFILYKVINELLRINKIGHNTQMSKIRQFY